MSNTKKYILTGVILGSIAAVAAGLIAVTNLVTKDRIANNDLEKLNLGIRQIFGDNASISAQEDLANEKYKYVVTFYEVKDGDTLLGYAFKSEGSNDYGKISMISGFDEATRSFVSLYLLENGQSYASTLVENYIVPLTNGDRDLEDVSCGATRGATLVKNMVNEASEIAKSYKK